MRKIVAGDVTWWWKTGRGGGVVAYAETGERRCAHASRIKGIHPDAFDHGKRKRTTDGMVMPAEVAKWLSSPNDKGSS